MSALYNHRWRVIVDPSGYFHPHFMEDKVPSCWEFVDSEPLSRSEAQKMVHELDQVKQIMNS